MNEFNTLKDCATELINKLDSAPESKKIGLLFAFNSTGKTRLSEIINSDIEEKILIYNAFFEDSFTWDNEECVLKINPESWIVSLIKDQGLDGRIIDNFQKLTQSKIYPEYDLDNGKITFNFYPGDERSEDNIKISRGEESLFIWSVFYTVLESAILALSVEEVKNRETNAFNNLEYIIIDDPVSSIDDTRIITIAVELMNTINEFRNVNIRFLITTHHPLFYNVLYNSFSSRNGNREAFKWILSKSVTGFKIEDQKDSPFGYHLIVKEKIQEAISTNSLEKYHFNLFRGLLEKTSNFLGYVNWTDCIRGDNKSEIIRLVNIYSHGRLSELESKHFPDEHKDLFKKAFEDFIKEFQWKA